MERISNKPFLQHRAELDEFGPVRSLRPSVFLVAGKKPVLLLSTIGLVLSWSSGKSEVLDVPGLARR